MDEPRRKRSPQNVVDIHDSGFLISNGMNSKNKEYSSTSAVEKVSISGESVYTLTQYSQRHALIKQALFSSPLQGESSEGGL
jgi:hypothetical protein